MNKLLYISLAGLLLALLASKGPSAIKAKVNSAASKKQTATTKGNLLKKPIELGFEQLVPDPKFPSLKMLGQVSKNGVAGVDGVLLRVLRLQPIGDAVELRYGLTGPKTKGIVLSVVAQESGGADLLPNGADDGGAGFAHMQPCTGHQYSLRIYQDCNKLVDHEHGRALRALITANNSDRKLLIKYDDRFHPVLNLDAVGRMLKSYMLAAPRGSDAAAYALKRYSGRTEYGAAVQKWRARINSDETVRAMKAHFDEVNTALTCDEYLAACRQQNVNYGLEKYKGIGVFKP